MELSWSQTPNKVWWALEASGASSVSLSLDDLNRTPSSPFRYGENSLRHDNDTSNIFYNYADETDYTETEEELIDWLRDDLSRGIIRVFQPGTSYSEIVKCSVDTTAETIMARCLAKELYVHYGCKRVRKVRLDEHPLQLQFRFLKELGHSNPYRIQCEGIHEDLTSLFKFVAGEEKGNRPEDKVQISCPLKVKELNGTIIPAWNRRFSVLCGSRMFVFASSRPRGKPTLVLNLQGGTIEEYKSKKYSYCLKIETSRHVLLLAFETRMEQSKWLERAGKIISKHPLEVNLAGYSLERVPKYYFLNYNIVALNLAHNFMIESFQQTDAAMLGLRRTIGWIDDIVIFQRLLSLSLSDNGLEEFPLALCNLANIQELDISCNRIKIIPQEIKHLTKLTTLLLHSNQLSVLPCQLKELINLSTLVVAFNRFFELPVAVVELPALRIFITSGNPISILPEEIEGMETLQHFDIRFNKVKSGLPPSAVRMRNLTRLNIRGNGIKKVDMTQLLYLEFFNCSDNLLRLLALNEGPMKILIAKNNKITQFLVPSTCEQLTSIDLSDNELTALPESLAELANLEKLVANNNKLTKLPSKIFGMTKLVKLRMSNNRLVTLPQRVSSKCPLRQLDLHSNQLTSLPPNLLSGCVLLEVLNVSSNQLVALPRVSTSVREPYRLLEFFGASNSLKDSCFSSLSRYQKLKVLHLAYNELKNIPSGFFSGMKSLEYLNFSGNLFSSIPPILSCPSLQCLIFHSNKIHSLPSFPILHYLHTLDLSCNQFENVPELTSFPHLKFLDLSGNSSLVVTEESAKAINVSQCCMEGILDIKTVKSEETSIETGGVTTHGKWSYGSGRIIGIDSTTDCTAQTKRACLNKIPMDGLFAVMDGSRSPKVAQAFSSMLEENLLAELDSEEKERREGFMDINPLQYLSYTFLTIHRKLGEMGQQHGSSAIVCHIHKLPNGSYVLNMANTGLGEAILCRSGRAVPLTTPHSPATNIEERARITDTKGFISQDNRVNGVCGASRLVGVYHLWPQVIPIPSTETVELREEDEYVVIATDSLWKFVSYEQIIQEARSISDPTQVAKRLRDFAVAHGCHTDVSVIVIKLNIDREILPLHSSTPKPKPLKDLSQPEPASGEEEEEEEEEEPGVTNIDDALSEEDEGTKDSSNKIPITALPIEPSTQEGIIDRMVLDAVSPRQGVASNLEDKPTMQSTNFDDLPLSDDESPVPPSPVIMDSIPSSLPNKVEAPLPEAAKHGLSVYKEGKVAEVDYEAQTIPKKTSQSKKSGAGFTDLETSYEQTQSVPTLQMASYPNPQSLSNPVSNQLVTLNAALIRLDEEEGFSTSPGNYYAESIERQRPKKGGTSRLSYVEHSYNKLTNEVYSRGSIVHSVDVSHDLDTWVEL